MWGKSGDEAERLFRSQFEHDHGRYLFRYGKRSAPVVVTAEEMEESVVTYRRRSRRVTHVGVLAMMAAIVGFVFSGSTFLDRDGAIWLLILVWIVPFMIAITWAWKSPTHHFLRRAPVGSERTRSEVRARMLSEWGWSKIVMSLGGGFVLAAYGVLHWPPTTIESWIWFALGVFLVVVGTANAIMKWRLGRS